LRGQSRMRSTRRACYVLTGLELRRAWQQPGFQWDRQPGDAAWHSFVSPFRVLHFPLLMCQTYSFSVSAILSAVALNHYGCCARPAQGNSVPREEERQILVGDCVVVSLPSMLPRGGGEVGWGEGCVGGPMWGEPKKFGNCAADHQGGIGLICKPGHSGEGCLAQVTKKELGEMPNSSQ